MGASFVGKLYPVVLQGCVLRTGEGLKAGVYFLRSSDSKDKPLRIVKVR